jgi:glycosyltransferase involved in cell wall biosynthesis
VENNRNNGSSTFSCVVPIRNEAGNLPDLFQTLIKVPKLDEIIFVEGGSQDNSYEVISILSKGHDRVRVLKQKGIGKFDAVLEGIDSSFANHVVIWDADSTISLEDTTRMLDQAASSLSLVTGNRLTGTRAPKSMRFMNLLGNHFFSICFMLVLNGKKIDTLCGTKIFPKGILGFLPRDVLVSDPFGDFSIIFGAIMAKIPIKSLPVQYSARKYGNTNIRRWRAGVQLILLFLRLLKLLRSVHKN